MKKIKFFFLIVAAVFCGIYGAKAFWIFGDDKENYPTQKMIDFYYDEYYFRLETGKDTLKELLDEQEIIIENSDFIFPPVDSELFSGMVIRFKKAIAVKVLADGEEISKKTIYRKVTDVLNDAGVTLSHLDKTQPARESFIGNNEEIIVTRINIEEIEEKENIDFKVIEKEDDDLKWRKEEVKQKGEKGIKNVRYEITYKNGKEISRKKLSSEIIKDPVDEIIKIGTKIEIGKIKNGLASWYAHTGTMACASRMFPRGTWLRVTNKANGKKIFVQVNDYGPMRGTGKMIDLDKVAFEKIASLGQGVVEVKVEEILD